MRNIPWTDVRRQMSYAYQYCGPLLSVTVFAESSSPSRCETYENYAPSEYAYPVDCSTTAQGSFCAAFKRSPARWPTLYMHTCAEVLRGQPLGQLHSELSIARRSAKMVLYEPIRSDPKIVKKPKMTVTEEGSEGQLLVKTQDERSNSCFGPPIS